MRLVSLLAIFAIVSCASSNSLLYGKWQTDVERTTASMESVGSVPLEHQAAVAGSFDEIEWVIDKNTWHDNMVGDDPIMLGFGNEEFRYRVVAVSGTVLRIERWGNKGTHDISEVTVGVDGCLELKNIQYGYIEYKCPI